jgi:hypothetical protein
MLLEFRLFGLGGAGHARQLGVEQKEVLVGNAGQGLGFGLDLHVLFGLDRLMQAIAPAATGHDPAGKLIDDDDLIVADDVVDVFGEQLLGLDRIEDVVGPGILGIKQILHPQHLFGLDKAFVGEQHVTGFFVHFVVLVGRRVGGLPRRPGYTSRWGAPPGLR